MLIRRTLLYMPAQILGPAAQFVAILVFTHYMAPEPYGVFTFVLASQDFVFLLSLSWWSQYTLRYLGDRDAEADERYRRSEVPIVAGTIVLQIAASLLALRLILDRISMPIAAATMLYTVSRCLALHLGERARARNQIMEYTLAQAAGPLTGLVLAMLTVTLIAPTPEAALAGYGIAQLLTLIWLATRQDITFTLRRPDAPLMRQAFAFGLPLIAAGLAAWCGMNAIRILVDHRLGAAAMGLIAVGWGLGNRLTSTAAMLVTVAAYPLAVESLRTGSRERAYAQIASNGLLMLGLVLPAAVGLYFIQGPLVARLVAGPFREMTLAVLPAALAAGLFRNIRTHVADQVFMLIERTRMVFVMTLIETLLVIVGCAGGLVLAGPTGAAYGSAAGYGVALIASFVVARLVAGLAIPLRGTALVGLAVAAMAATLVMLPNDVAGKGQVFELIAKIMIGVAIYVFAVIALFPPIARQLLSRWRRVAIG